MSTRTNSALWSALRVAIVALWSVSSLAGFADAQTRSSRVSSNNLETARTQAAQAVDALFAHSDINSARSSAGAALALLQTAPATHKAAAVQADALFVEMEAAALEADSKATLDAALGLCELRVFWDDPRTSIASSRILDIAGNTSEFRTVIPHVQSAIAKGSSCANNLRTALLVAAEDGVPNIPVIDLAHKSGLLTDWKIAGPFGKYANVAFERRWEPEQDGMHGSSYNGRVVEQFRFENGEVNLPAYFSDGGVFYAAAQVSIGTPGEWRIRVESQGTLEAWVDRKRVVTKDDRFLSSAETIGAALPVRSGVHRVLVKFLPSATPFRVAMLPPVATRTVAAMPETTSAEAQYISSAQAYWSGNYAQAIKELTQLRSKHDSTAVDYLLALSGAHAGEEAAERAAVLKHGLQLAPSALAIEQELASIALSQEQFTGAAERARHVLEARPASGAAAHLFAASAAQLNSPDAMTAYDTAVSLHPSCEILREADAFAVKASDFRRAKEYEIRLLNCSPQSIAGIQALVAAGHHGEAASAAEGFVADHPLDRQARSLLVHELVLDGKLDQARTAARELAELAPNSEEYRNNAAELEAGGLALDSADADREFASERPFYAAYRRDGVEVVLQTANRKFSGGPAVFLLNDEVAEVHRNGSAAVYVHKVTRVLDRNGIARYGEVTVPKEASLIELRTIKADGTIVEPEFTEHKSTVSMPALAAGDAIDLEYVVPNLEGGIGENPSTFQFTFGSFSAPIVLSRFVLISPEDAKLKFVPFGDVPVVTVSNENGIVTRSWQGNDVPQSTTEVAMPQTGVLPSIQIFAAEEDGWAGVRDFYRDAFIEASHIGRRVESTAGGLREGSDEKSLRAAYQLVMMRVRREDYSYDAGDITSAENTLQEFNGSRTAALLAIARTMGIPGYVMMARDVSPQAPEVASVHAYTHPLLVLSIKAEGGTAHDVVLDTETDGLAFGSVTAGLERKDALVIPIETERKEPVLATVPKPLADEQSSADGDVTFSSAGDLSAHVVIRMGATRAAQMRTKLASVDPADRKLFFEQLAERIFPGINYADGKVRNESDLDQPLVLEFECRTSHFIELTTPSAAIDQLVPALGLRGMYSTGSVRRTPLLIDTPLVETATFRIHLPATMHFAGWPRDADAESEFGTYSVSFRQVDASTMEVRREFSIPVQIVPVERFNQFAEFARQIDDAEHQQLTARRLTANGSQSGED